MNDRLLTLTEFRALRDANALASIRARLPELEAKYKAARMERQRIGREVNKIEARKECDRRTWKTNTRRRRGHGSAPMLRTRWRWQRSNVLVDTARYFDYSNVSD